MRYHYVWLIWSTTFLIPWVALFALNANARRVMWRMSLVTALFGLTEPIFVPEYWNPPSLFEVAQRTGFDIESLIFSFAIGGIGAVLYNSITKSRWRPVLQEERSQRKHRFHRVALLAPYIAFPFLYPLPWNPIYAAEAALVFGAAAAVLCRPDLVRNTVWGALLFLGLYAVFMLGLRLAAPGYIAQVWNLRDLTGVLIAGVPLEELVFGFTFGAYWAGLYEHFAWHTRAPRATHPPA